MSKLYYFNTYFGDDNKKSMRCKQYIFLFVLCLVFNDINAQQADKSNKWFIVLPLRFTHLQANNTMLSGLKVGREVNQHFSASVSIYHSFYLRSFRAEANIGGFEEKPRLFIYAVGGELAYLFFQTSKYKLLGQVLLDWGFMGYTATEQNFSSDNVSYLALEPMFEAEFKVGKKSSLGIGIGYRPLFGRSDILYSSDISDGSILIQRDLPNGLNLLLSYKGYF